VRVWAEKRKQKKKGPGSKGLGRKEKTGKKRTRNQELKAMHASCCRPFTLLLLTIIEDRLRILLPDRQIHLLYLPR